MKRSPGTGSVYLRSDGRWVAMVSYGRQGSRKRFVAYGRTREEAEARLPELQAKYAALPPFSREIARPTLTIGVGSPLSPLTIAPEDIDQHVSEIVHIPCYRRGGIAAWAVVDRADAELARYRWGLNTTGYVFRSHEGRDGKYVVFLHRAVLGLGRDAGIYADHVNRDPLDNRRGNLRIVTAAQNAQNKPRTNGGVYKRLRADGRPYWRAQVGMGGRVYHLGTFDTEAEAVEVARRWREEHMPYATN